jgi:GH18 family chitinase
MKYVPYIRQWQTGLLILIMFYHTYGVAKEPLPLVLLENNQPYTNTTNSIVASYYPEWGIYERDFPVAKIPAQNLTHIFYAFIAICGPNESLRNFYEKGWQVLQEECADQPDYTVTIYDRWAALDKAFEGDQASDPIKGNFGQLMRLKLAKPDIKIMPSFGGWTLSDPFYTLANNATHRQTFVNSVIAFLKEYPLFDGVDIDWEYPGGGGLNPDLGSSADYEGYADLMRDLRQAINELEQETGRSYLLTSAVGVVPQRINSVNYTRAAQYLDYVLAMDYDFYGSWNGELGHHTALYASDHQKHANLDADSGIRNLINAGIPANKLVLGVAKYGRGWINVTGVNSGESPFINGVGNGAHPGTWESGNLDYRDIANNYLSSDEQGKNGYNYFYDEKAEAPYLWNASSGRLITYENKRSAKAKAEYARNNNLAGVFSWEIDADNGDILNSMHEGLGHGSETPPVAAGSLKFSQATYSVNEGIGSKTITVSRTGGSDGSVSVDYAINNGTATSGNDYSATPGTLTWNDGDSSNKLITVNIIDDNIQESSENFSLALSNATGDATIGYPNNTVVRIIDNDSANNCPHATFSVADKKITIPMLDMPLLDSMTGEPNGNIAVLQAELAMTEGVGDFKMIPESVSVIAGEQPNAECHASYSYETRIMHLPFVDVSSTIMLPPNIVIDGPIQVFDANLQQLQLYNDIFHLKDYTYLYELE